MLVLLLVVELVAVTDKLIVEVDEPVPVLLLLSDGNAPIVREEVGVRLIDLDKLCVFDGVISDVEVPLFVADDVGELVAVDELVILSEFELLAGVFEGLDPIERVADD